MDSPNASLSLNARFVSAAIDLSLVILRVSQTHKVQNGTDVLLSTLPPAVPLSIRLHC